jgi:hypothetical protein
MPRFSIAIKNVLDTWIRVLAEAASLLLRTTLRRRLRTFFPPTHARLPIAILLILVLSYLLNKILARYEHGIFKVML